MELKIRQTKLKGVVLIEPPTNHRDFRGFFVETFNEMLYRKAGIKVKFVQDDFSLSKKNVLRGIHGDQNTWKLATCIHGKIHLVVIDCDPASRFFGKHVSWTLSERNRFQVLIPPKHGVAHLVMSPVAILGYKQSAYYDRAGQFTFKWNDPRFKSRWSVRKPILSERDQKGI